MSGGWLDNSARPIDNTVGDATLGLPMYTDPTLQPRGASFDEYPAQEQTVVRWTTVWQPTENFDATLKVFHSESGLQIGWMDDRAVKGEERFRCDRDHRCVRDLRKVRTKTLGHSGVHPSVVDGVVDVAVDIVVFPSSGND